MIDWKDTTERPNDGNDIIIAFWYDFWKFCIGTYQKGTDSFVFIADGKEESLTFLDCVEKWAIINYPKS